ncbi:MAG TPA: hypothetical protein PKI19_06365 [Elusimicrobiales bacterium]|nr:hypothetical protein [Elusimicrobiales bacterium]
MRHFTGIKPQDIAILLKLVTLGNNKWRHIDLAEALGLSQTEISFAMDRCRTAGFIDADKKTVIKPALLEFLIHGLKYVFPAKPGPVGRGIPTAHSAPPLSRLIVAANDDHYVWPNEEEGKVRGQAIEPLYPNAPLAAITDNKLYELLALFDALRIGKARERGMALARLQALIDPSPPEN